jgi:glycosyltransferase involved in cell wall biosynthesis
LRVLVFTPNYPRYKGDYHGSFIRDLCTRLARHVDLTVLAPRSRTMGASTDGFPVHRYPYLPWRGAELVAESTLVGAPALHIAQLPMYLASAYLHLVKEGFDVVHTHMAIPQGLLAVHSPRKTQNLVTCHGSDCILPVIYPILWPLTGRSLRRAHRVTAVSDHVKSLAVSLGADGEKTETVYLGVDTKRFKPGLGVRDGDKVTVGTLGRLVSEKNVGDILHALKVVEHGMDVRLLVGGDGPRHDHLRSLAHELRLKDVEFLGRVNDPAGFHRGCDVFVLASTREGLSVSLQEAMSSGCVPVAVNGHGCRELITHGRNGLLFEPRNVDDLASKIVEAANSPRMGAQARETILRRFNIDRNHRRYLEIYREMAS